MSVFVLATAGYEASVRFFDTGSQALLRSLPFPDENVTCLAFSREGPVNAGEPLYLAVAGGLTVSVYLVSTANGELRPIPFMPFREHTQPVTACGFEAKHTSFVYSASEDGTLQTWIPQTGSLPLEFPNQVLRNCAPAQEADRSKHPQFRQSSGLPFLPSKFLNHGPSGLVAIHDATYYLPKDLFFTIDAVGRLRIWDREAGKLQKELIPHCSRRSLQCLELSSNYAVLVMANFDGFVFVYDVKRAILNSNDVLPVSFRPHSSYISRVRLSPAADILVCITLQGVLKVFRMDDLSATQYSRHNAIAPVREIESNPYCLWDAAFIGDSNKCILTCGRDVHVVLWDLVTSEHIREYGVHGKDVTCLAVKEITVAVHDDQAGAEPSGGRLVPSSARQ